MTRKTYNTRSKDCIQTRHILCNSCIRSTTGACSITCNGTCCTSIKILKRKHTHTHTTAVCCLQSKLPTPQSANITAHCTQNEKTVTIQLCQYWYPSSNIDWLVHNELEMDVEVITACLKYQCNICLKGQSKANENLSG